MWRVARGEVDQEKKNGRSEKLFNQNVKGITIQEAEGCVKNRKEAN